MTFALVTRTRHSIGIHGRYLAEICRSEGLTAHLVDLDEEAELEEELRRFQTVVVSCCSLSGAEIALLIEHLGRGGTLVAIKPSRHLAKALGLQPLDYHLPAAYVRTAAGDPIGSGLTDEPVQTLAPLELFKPVPQATVHAWSGGEGETGEPAVFSFASGDGTAVVFAYEVARAIARLRHGDSALAGTRSQGGHPYRCTDLMLDQLDRNRWHLPQADLQAQLLTNAIIAHSKTPLPRWW